MRSRVVAIVAVLLAVLMALTYLAVGVTVRGSADKTLKHAAKYALNGKSVLAREELKWLLWFEPRHPAALHLTAMSYLKQNNLPAAIEYLSRVGEDPPLHEPVESLLASTLLADQQLDQAEDVLIRHLLRYPKSAIGRRQLCGLFLTELRSREALQVQEEFLRAVSAAPVSLSDRLSILRDLAMSEFHLPAAEGCLKSLENALKQHRDQPHVELALGRCYLQLGKLDAAEPLLENCLAREPHGIDSRLLNCELWIAKGNLDQAEAALVDNPRKAISSAANAPMAIERDDRFWDLRCRITEARGQFDQALSDIGRALAIRPASREYEARRARNLQKTQRIEESQQAYAQSHELARAELALWKMSRDIGLRVPDAAECEQVARDYESLGKRLQADSWRQLGQQIAAEAPKK